METMTGLDAKFLYSETPTAHMHTVKVAVADVSDIEGRLHLRGVRRGPRSPARPPPPVPPPGGAGPGRLGHPVWVEDPDFELRRHVRRTVLPAPGDEAQLAAVVGEFASLPLKRDRPLWELLFVEGLAGGRMAVVAKLHHAVADGTAVVALLHSVVRGMSEEPPDQPPGGPVAARAHPRPPPAAQDGLPGPRHPAGRGCRASWAARYGGRRPRRSAAGASPSARPCPSTASRGRR